jgi:AraC family transcriptional regulator
MFTEAEYVPHLFIPKHTHADGYFDFVISGGFTELSARTETEQAPGSISFHCAGVTHKDKFSGTPTRSLSVELRSAWWKASHTEPPPCLEPAGSPLSLLAAKAHAHLRGGLPGFEHILESIGLEMASHLVQISSRSNPPSLRRVREFLHDNATRAVSLSEVAGVAVVHPAHLCRAFRQEYGVTVGEYHRRLQVHNASEKLRKTDMPIVEIAVEVGFFDQSHLTKLFKAIVGLTPGEYRRAFRRSGHEGVVVPRVRETP